MLNPNLNEIKFLLAKIFQLDSKIARLISDINAMSCLDSSNCVAQVILDKIDEANIAVLNFRKKRDVILTNIIGAFKHHKALMASIANSQHYVTQEIWSEFLVMMEDSLHDSIIRVLDSHSICLFLKISIQQTNESLERLILGKNFKSIIRFVKVIQRVEDCVDKLVNVVLDLSKILKNELVNVKNAIDQLENGINFKIIFALRMIGASALIWKEICN